MTKANNSIQSRYSLHLSQVDTSTIKLFCGRWILLTKNIGLEYNMNVSTDRRFRLSDFENQKFIDILNDNRNYHTFKLNYKF